MDIIFIAAGLIIMAYSVFSISNRKKSFSADELLDFERTIRPTFLKYYFLTTLPLLVALFSILLDDLALVRYFWGIFSVVICFDVLTIYKMRIALNNSQYSSMPKLFNYFVGVLIGKTAMLLGLKFYIDLNT